MYLISTSTIRCYFSSFLCCRVFSISGWLDEHGEADWGLIQVSLCLLKQVELWDSRSYALYGQRRIGCIYIYGTYKANMQCRY